MKTLFDFFHEHAGYSYDPRTETPEQGRNKCAESLAIAATRAFIDGFWFDWCVDQTIDSSDFSDDTDPWELWVCCMYDTNGNMVDSLSAIDFGRNGSPYGDPYMRVVEAEIALSCFSNSEG